MDIRKVYGTNKKDEQEGKWEDFGEGLSVKIARMGNPNYSKKFREIAKPYQKSIRRGTLGEQKSEELLIQAMADTILLDWKGLEENGKPVKFTREEAIRVMTEYPDFRDAVSEVAGAIETFKLEEDEAGRKN